jgi:poly-gamma-glutamate synthesis protein (capsule biosynthesis protein)
LAEEAHGPIARPVELAYIWGDALDALKRAAPDVRIVNLETAITTSEDYWKGKGIHYRMHPKNVACLTAANIDCCVLANNHVLDWGYAGLRETVETLTGAGIKTAGAGQTGDAAEQPAVLDVPDKGRVLVFSFGSPSSGIPPAWAASGDRPGVSFLHDMSAATVQRIAGRIRAAKQPGDIVVASIHWGDNWGYRIPNAHTAFAHRLIDEAGVDVIHGHSSHHPKGIEVYRGRPILYGCGDLLNDYEGIHGYEEFRPDLALMYLVRIEPSTRTLGSVEMIPTQTKRLRVNRATAEDARGLTGVLDRQCQPLGSHVELQDGMLVLRWR